MEKFHRSMSQNVEKSDPNHGHIQWLELLGRHCGSIINIALILAAIFGSTISDSVPDCFNALGPMTISELVR